MHQPTVNSAHLNAASKMKGPIKLEIKEIKMAFTINILKVLLKIIIIYF